MLHINPSTWIDQLVRIIGIIRVFIDDLRRRHIVTDIDDCRISHRTTDVIHRALQLRFTSIAFPTVVDVLNADDIARLHTNIRSVSGIDINILIAIFNDHRVPRLCFIPLSFQIFHALGETIEHHLRKRRSLVIRRAQSKTGKTDCQSGIERILVGLLRGRRDDFMIACRASTRHERTHDLHREIHGIIFHFEAKASAHRGKSRDLRHTQTQTGRVIESEIEDVSFDQALGHVNHTTRHLRNGRFRGDRSRSGHDGLVITLIELRRLIIRQPGSVIYFKRIDR